MRRFFPDSDSEVAISCFVNNDDRVGFVIANWSYLNLVLKNSIGIAGVDAKIWGSVREMATEIEL